VKKNCLVKICVAFTIAYSGIASANESNTSFAAPLVQESLLLDAAVGENTLIVGERGHILLAPKNSNDYVQVQSPTNATLTAVSKLQDQAWIVGHDASIMKSSDAGKTWQLIQQAPELDRPLLDVHFFDNDEGIAVGAYGLFYRSVDSGNTWVKESHASVLSEDDNAYLDSIKDDEDFYQEELSFISPHFNRLSESNGMLLLAGEAGLVAVSEDRGNNWSRLDIDYLGSFFDVKEIQEGQIMAVGLRGNIFVQNDDSWQRLESCVTTSLNTIISHNNEVYVVGNNGVVLGINTALFNSQDYSDSNSEGCNTHSAVTLLDTEFSDAILDLVFINDQVEAVTSGGLQAVTIEE